MKSSTKNLKSRLLGVATALSLLAAPAAHASLVNGIVDTWTVDVDAEFVVGSAVFTAGSGSTSVSSSSLRWGITTGSGQSGLDITNGSTSNPVDTNGPAISNMSVTHLNRPIDGNSKSLDKVTLRSYLTLTPFDPASAGLPQTFLDFEIDFLETPNAANPCAGGGVNGSGVNSAGCADIFVIDKNALNFPFFYDLDGVGGPLQDQKYYISFFELTSGLNPLPAAACAAVGVAGPCLGFRTPEGTDTTVEFAAMITTDPVHIPEPGTLAILGLGLAALGMTRRRKTEA